MPSRLYLCAWSVSPSHDEKMYTSNFLPSTTGPNDFWLELSNFIFRVLVQPARQGNTQFKLLWLIAKRWKTWMAHFFEERKKEKVRKYFLGFIRIRTLKICFTPVLSNFLAIPHQHRGRLLSPALKAMALGLNSSKEIPKRTIHRLWKSVATFCETEQVHLCETGVWWIGWNLDPLIMTLRSWDQYAKCSRTIFVTFGQIKKPYLCPVTFLWA